MTTFAVPTTQCVLKTESPLEFPSSSAPETRLWSIPQRMNMSSGHKIRQNQLRCGHLCERETQVTISKSVSLLAVNRSRRLYSFKQKKRLLKHHFSPAYSALSYSHTASWTSLTPQLVCIQSHEAICRCSCASVCQVYHCLASRNKRPQRASIQALASKHVKFANPEV